VPQVETESLEAATMTEPWEDHVRRTYQSMVTARTLEAKLASLYKAGKIVGGVYIGAGQEAVSASLGSCLTWGRDIFAALIRDQAGRTAFGEPMLDATRTYLGAVTGPMRGRDGNVHRGRPTEGYPAMISHLGAMVSVVAGMLFARRLKGTMEGVVGAASVGDGASSTGSFHEALNLAAIEKLPLVVVLTNNQFAYSTPTDRQYACQNLVDRAVGYGVEGSVADGTDLLESLEVISTAVRRAREGHGPQLVVPSLLRLSGHGEHDDSFYIPEEMRKSHLGRDCLKVAEKQLMDHNIATKAELVEWKRKAVEEVQQAVATAQREPVHDPYKDDWMVLSTPGMGDQQ
jgi:pyruvate dehydrogenase E1 component alpha subunit/2-oxoisovalerate dehydrogenase E1 component alpha subunit